MARPVESATPETGHHVPLYEYRIPQAHVTCPPGDNLSPTSWLGSALGPAALAPLLSMAGTVECRRTLPTSWLCFQPANASSLSRLTARRRFFVVGSHRDLFVLVHHMRPDCHLLAHSAGEGATTAARPRQEAICTYPTRLLMPRSFFVSSFTPFPP